MNSCELLTDKIINRCLIISIGSIFISIKIIIKEYIKETTTIMGILG